jgi:serine/threonine protein kinase
VANISVRWWKLLILHCIFRRFKERGPTCVLPSDILHKGDLSTVFEVYRHEMVIKISSGEHRRLVRREVAALQRLQDIDGVIKLVDHSDNALLLAPLANITLRRLFGLQQSRPRSCVAGIVRVLQQCHSKGVLHRDCRDTNILVLEDCSESNPSPQFVLADFGCSCLADNPVDCAQFMGAPRNLRSEHLLSMGSSFRPADDLHIFARSIYALKPLDKLSVNSSHPKLLATRW